MEYSFITRNGESLKGTLIRKYTAVEGGERYIISCNGTEYRCVRNADGVLVEHNERRHDNGKRV